jgi:hypothetical protein
VTTYDQLLADNEYLADFDRLILKAAEEARLEGARLREAGFDLILVHGGPGAVVWVRGDKYFTTAAALREVDD